VVYTFCLLGRTRGKAGEKEGISVSSEILGLLIGAAFIFPAIAVIRAKCWDPTAWPLFLATLPVWYMLFGLLAMDANVAMMELLYGLPYLCIGLLVWRIKSSFTLIIIGFAWLSHGFYDLYHDVFFVNPGVFSWYPAFCGFVDLVAGIFLLTAFRRQFNLSNAAT
jgi:hypothetical protein